MKAVGVVIHLFYTSKILLIVLELNHLIYKHVYFIYIRNESCWCGKTLILYFKNTVDSSGTKPFDIYTRILTIYIYAMKAVGVVGDLFYSSKILLILLELNHLIYRHLYCIYTQRKLLVWLDTYSILQKYC